MHAKANPVAAPPPLSLMGRCSCPLPAVWIAHPPPDDPRFKGHHYIEPRKQDKTPRGATRLNPARKMRACSTRTMTTWKSVSPRTTTTSSATASDAQAVARMRLGLAIEGNCWSEEVVCFVVDGGCVGERLGQRRFI